MSGDKLLLDTDAVSYFLAGKSELKSIITDKEIFVSFVTEMELLSSNGFTSTERKNIKAFLAQCLIIEMSSEIKKIAIQTRLSFRVKLPDAIIAATSLHLNIPLD